MAGLLAEAVLATSCYGFPMSTAALGYDIRPFRSGDAAGVSQLVREVYGDAYTVHEELYDPEAIAALNERGELVSIVAAAPGGEIVGHYALECSQPGVAETGEAMVSPDHRHHGLMEQMRELVEAAARRLKLLAIFGRCVTSHTFSQKSEERAGCLPCGLSLGNAPRTFHTVGQAPAQRMSTVMYAKLLAEHAAPGLHVPPRHRAMVGRIYEQWGLQASFSDATASAQASEIALDARPDLGEASFRAVGVGRDFAGRLALAVGEQQASGRIEALFLDVPLSRPGAAEAVAAAESQGFFFSGVAPGFFEGSDALCLQRPLVAMDLDLLQLSHPFSRELREYIRAERQRVGAPRP